MLTIIAGRLYILTVDCLKLFKFERTSNILQQFILKPTFKPFV